METKDSPSAPDAEEARRYWLLLVEEDRAESAQWPRGTTPEVRS
jgi:hypothetical protein